MNAGISPVANEICDEIDNDCDEETDEGVQNTYYVDADSDQYGDPSNIVMGCSLQFGYVSNSNDCDDMNSLINPSSLEYCDMVEIVMAKLMNWEHKIQPYGMKMAIQTIMEL